MRGFWFLDPELKDDSGHYLHFARAVAQEARRRNIRMLAVGNREARGDLLEGVRLVPAFRGMTHSFLPTVLLGYVLNPLLGGRAYYRELSHSLPRNACKDVVAFAATANHRHVSALARWIERFPPGESPALLVYLRFHFRDPVSGRALATAGILRRGLRKLEVAAARRGRIVLVTDSEFLASEYRSLSTLPVATLSVPHMIPETELAALASSEADNHGSGAVRFAFPGEARPEKGYDVLVRAILELHARGRLKGITISMQSYHADLYPVDPWTRKLTALNAHAVHLVPGALDSKSYYRFLAESDVILIPHRRSTYAARSSGIFAEALAVGKPVIVAEGTWMSAQLQHAGAGVLFEDGNPADLARAILEVRDSLPLMKEKALASRSDWAAKHDIRPFFAALLEAAGRELPDE